MPQWEYLEVYTFEGAWADNRGRRGDLDEVVKVKNRIAHSRATLLNDLGSQGWELVGLECPASAYDPVTLFFKRPKRSP